MKLTALFISSMDSATFAFYSYEFASTIRSEHTYIHCRNSKTKIQLYCPPQMTWMKSKIPHENHVALCKATSNVRTVTAGGKSSCSEELLPVSDVNLRNRTLVTLCLVCWSLWTVWHHICKGNTSQRWGESISESWCPVTRCCIFMLLSALFSFLPLYAPLLSVRSLFQHDVDTRNSQLSLPALLSGVGALWHYELVPVAKLALKRT
jgi:hypothetical protein